MDLRPLWKLPFIVATYLPMVAECISRLGRIMHLFSQLWFRSRVVLDMATGGVRDAQQIMLGSSLLVVVLRCRGSVAVARSATLTGTVLPHIRPRSPPVVTHSHCRDDMIRGYDYDAAHW
jgi:hypothetical protein